ncbi:MFS transporter [bacterium]|nr:MFS transporter [bacterium]
MERNESPFIAFSHPDFRYYSAARFLALASHQMLAVAMAQYLYQVTKNPLHLGWLGLSLFLPKFIFTVPAGHLADIYDRRLLILLSRLAQFFVMVLMTALYFTGKLPIMLVYPLLFILGAAYAFDGPASFSFLPDMIPKNHFGNAVAWNSSNMQLAFIAGPALAGFIYAFSSSPREVLIIVTAMRFLSYLLINPIAKRPTPLRKEVHSWHELLAGVRFVFHKKIILGTISLDLFAVLFGGAVALLPVYANDILHVGAKGLGILRASPSVGAALMAIYLAHYPIKNKTGLTMLKAVFIFGVFTVVFGLSKNFFLSLSALFILGAADMISVVIRGIMVQMETPEEMRGRVSAVNLVFIGASNELGEFESGAVASLIGTVPTVVLGGFATMGIVWAWSRFFPELKTYERIQ